MRVMAQMRGGSAVLLAGRGVQLLNSLLLSAVIVRRFGLSTVGVFAIGFIAVTVLTSFGALGLSSYLPRVRQSHPRLCYAALAIHLGLLPAVLLVVYLYGRSQARTPEELATICIVSSGGFLIALSNTGLMLSIMKQRFYPGLVAPLAESVGLLTGAILASSAVELAMYHVVGRLFGVVAIWIGFGFRRMSIVRISCIARRSARYVIPDLLALMSEQSAPLLLTWFVSRADLGVFRLCQQFLTAADTPGWSFVQSKYPAMVTARPAFMEELRLQVGRLGWLAAAACFSGATMLAILVYRLPQLTPMMAVLSVTLFWRYQNNFFEQAFRASGKVRIATTLAIAKLAVSFIAFLALIYTLALWGAILALASLSIGSGMVYEAVYRRDSGARTVVVEASA
jgi:O-antigen/teichoic acid export membrane protein